MPGELLTTSEAADLLGVSRSTATRLIEAGVLPAYRLPTRPGAQRKGHWRVRRADAEALLRQMQNDQIPD